MPVVGNSEQNSTQTLEVFYQELSGNSSNAYVHVGRKMLLLLRELNNMFSETLIWGLTSHARLVLQNKDDWRADWFVIISSLGTEQYYIEYLLPADRGPWPNAFVRGEAGSLSEAKKYVLIAMAESGGWQECSELKKLLADIERL